MRESQEKDLRRGDGLVHDSRDGEEVWHAAVHVAVLRRSGIGRDDAGRRVYGDEHIGRLEAIACFKHAGMSIDELKRFFAYEGDERTHISDMVELLENRRDVIVEQRASLEEAYMHVLRKLHLYKDLQSSYENGTQPPDWADYDGKDFR